MIMPRSFLVKRRKSEDAKSVFDSDFPNNNEDVVKQNTVASQSQRMEFHPPSLHFNSLERNHATWNHSNTPCFHYGTRTLPHVTDSCVNLAARSKCVEPHCCGCFHRKLEEHAGCFCCISPTPKLLSDVTQLHVSPWCTGINYEGGYHGIYLPKCGPFYPKALPMPTPLKRLEFQTQDVPHKKDDDVPMHHIGKDVAIVGTRSEADIKFVKKEETLIHDTTAREDKVETTDEIPTKKMKMATTVKDHVIEKDDSGEASTLEKTTQLNIIEDKQTDVNETEKLPVSRVKIKQEFSKPLNANTNDSELCNGEINSHEESETKAMDVQKDVPQKVTRKPQHTKSKKGIKDGIVKPYNTRLTTSRPRAYSSDFVIPEEEDDWKQDKQGYQMKCRQRSKLNRLLANEHERRRVSQLNSAYQDLRQLIPGYQCDTKLPKIKILKYAINYIAHLDDILESV